MKYATNQMTETVSAQMDAIMIQFGQEVKKCRNRKKITTIKLGEFLEVSDSEISRIENGKRNLTLPIILTLCEKLQIDYKILFRYKKST